MPLDLRCWQVRQKKKKKNTIRTFHTCREGSQRFMLPATCPRGCLLSRDLRRSRVWSADDEKTSLEEVCGRGVFVAGTLGSKGGGTHRGAGGNGAALGCWLGLRKPGMKVLWVVEETKTVQMSPEWVFPTSSAPRCSPPQPANLSRAFWALRSYFHSTWRQGKALLFQAYWGHCGNVGTYPTPETLGEIMDSLSVKGVMLLPSVELGFHTIYKKGDKMTNRKILGRMRR